MLFGELRYNLQNILSENHISDEGAISLSDALRVNTSLTSLDLRRKSIGHAAAIFLSDASRVNTSRTLDLLLNSIGAEGASSLS